LEAILEWFTREKSNFHWKTKLLYKEDEYKADFVKKGKKITIYIRCRCIFA